MKIATYNINGIKSRLPRLLDWLDQQPAWSDVPVVMLAQERRVPAFAAERLGRLTNVSLLERPVSIRSMVSTVQAALSGRRRQYQIREHIARQAVAEAALFADSGAATPSMAPLPNSSGCLEALRSTL